MTVNSYMLRGCTYCDVDEVYFGEMEAQRRRESSRWGGTVKLHLAVTAVRVRR